MKMSSARVREVWLHHASDLIAAQYSLSIVMTWYEVQSTVRHGIHILTRQPRGNLACHMKLSLLQLIECPAMQTVRDRYPTWFAPAHSTMQLFLWQPDLVCVAHFIMDCFDAIGGSA